PTGTCGAHAVQEISATCSASFRITSTSERENEAGRPGSGQKRTLPDGSVQTGFAGPTLPQVVSRSLVATRASALERARRKSESPTAPSPTPLGEMSPG